MLFPRRRLQYQVVPCDWTSKSTHPFPRHRTDSALRFPSLLPPRQPPPCPQNPRGAEGVASLPPRRQRETSHGASGKLLPFGIGGCIHHGCNVSTFSCRDVFHAHSRVLPFWRGWRTPRGYNVSAAPPHHALCKLLSLWQRWCTPHGFNVASMRHAFYKLLLSRLHSCTPCGCKNSSAHCAFYKLLLSRFDSCTPCVCIVTPSRHA